MNLLDYALAGYEGRQTEFTYTSSPAWFAEQAGKEARKAGIRVYEVKMSRGYSVRINRDYIFKFDTQTLAFEGISHK